MALRDIQSRIQKAKAARDKQLAASTTATQSGSTNTPTTTETPKVVSTPKVEQTQTTQNLQVDAKNLLGTITPTSISNIREKAELISQKEGANLISKDETEPDSPGVLRSLVNAYNTLSGSTKDVVGEAIKDNGLKILNKMYQKSVRENNFTRNVDNLFSTATIDTARFGISTAQGYLTKEYYSDLLPSSTNMFANMMLPGYALYADKLNKGLNNTQIGKQIREKRDNVLGAIFDETEKRDQSLANISDYKEAKKTADKRAEQGKGISDAINEGNWDVVTTRVGETIGQMIPGFIVATITKNKKAAASAIFGTVFGDSYKRSILEVNNNPEYDHLTPEQKDNLATLMALAEAGIETLGDVIELAPFMKGKEISIADMLGLKGVLTRFIADWQGGAIIEGGEEVITEILQNIFKRAYGGSDKATAKELGEIFSDTYLIMQFVGLAGGAKGGVETHRRRTVEKLLEHEAENFDNFEEFEAAAEQGGVEDEDLIQDAWANAKGLTAEQSIILKRDTKYVQEQEQKARDLYEEKAVVESTLNTLRQSLLDNNWQVTKLETRIKDIDNQIKDINTKIEEYNQLYGPQELPAQKKQTQMPKEVGGENLSQQTMKELDNDIRYNKQTLSISEKPQGKDRDNMRKIFEKSFEQVDKKGRDYSSTPFARIAYSSSGKVMLGDKKQVQAVKDKIKFIADKAGIILHSTWKMPLGVGGGYGKGNILYNKKMGFELTIYGHEIYHGMMEIIKTGSMSDTKLGNELKKDMEAILNEAKEYLGIDGYEGEKGKLAYKYAEEWLANAFGEYLAEREINLGPKTFKQKVINFFERLVNAVFGREKTDKEMSPEMRRVFEAIYEGKVTTDYNGVYQEVARASETKMFDEMGMSESSRWDKTMLKFNKQIGQPTIRKINTKLKQATDDKEIKSLQKEKDKILKPYISNMQEWINKPISEYTDSDLYVMNEVIFSNGSLTKDKYEKAREIMDEMEKRQRFVDEMTIRELEEEAEVESGKRKEALEREIKDRKYNAKLSFMKDMSADVKAMSDDKLELFSDELFDRILSKKMLNDTLLVEKYKEVSNELRLRGLVEGKDGLHTAGVHSLAPGADINTIISVAIDEFAAGSYAVKDLDKAIEEIQKNITKSKWYNKISLMSQSVIDELFYPSAKNEKPGEVLELLKRRRENLFNNMREKVLGSPSIMRGILSNQLGTYYGQTASNDLINLFSARGVTIRSTFYDKDGSIKPMTQEEAQQWSKTISDICKILGINLDKLYRDTSVVINSHNKQELPSSGSSFKTLGLFKPYNEYSRAIAFSTERDNNSLVHEIIHSIELKLLLDEGFEYDSNLGWVSDENGHILSNDQIKLLLDNINSGKGDTNYRERPAELFARTGEQYFAEKVGDTRYRNEPWYWNKDFFDSTIKPMVEDILKNSGYKYEQGENIEADILYNLGLLNKDLKDIESRAIEKKISTNEVAAELNNLQSRYDEIDNMVDSMPEGNEKDEMMLEMSSLSENIRLLAQGGEEYFDMQRNTKEQQTQMDNGVNEISDNGTYLMSEVEDNQQEGEIVDDAMKEEIEEDKEPDTTGPLDVAVAKTVDKVISSANKVINKDVKEKPVNEQKAAKEKMKSIRDVGQGIKDVFTPALSRLYSISPRLAGAVHVYQASVGLKTLGYKRLSEDFVKALDNLKKKNPEDYKKLSLALFDWGMDESIDIKQSLKDAGLDEKLFEPVVSILNQIAKDYQSAGLDITINDKYFPRKVKDYGLLLDYLSRKSGTNIKDTRGTMIKQIEDINNDPNLSEGEKEKKVHELLINNFTKPSERSNNAKERKLVLSERLLTDEERNQGYVNDITDFYEDPIVALSNYIDDMVKKTELKKMLGGLTNDKTAISEKFDDSIAKILLDMENRGELTPEKAEEAKKVIKSIVNARATGKGAQRIKNLTYSMTIANRLSAAQQLEDLSKALLRGPTGFKNIVKAIIGKANIKMDDTGLENAFAQFEGGNITDTLFKLSGFDAVDALGKNSFLNTAYDSCVRQANSEKRNIILKTRLTQMYGEEMGNSIFESYKNNELRDKDGHLKLDVMVDLMYQLGNTQPIYKSAMPTAYLNNPKIRVAYCLWSFTVKQVDWLIQGTKEVYNNQRLLGRSKAAASMAATGRCIGALSVVSIISAMVTDLINWAKGDDDELMFKKWREEGFGAFLKQFGINSLSGLLKIVNISKYDQYISKREGIGGVLMSKITPAPLSIFSDVIQILMGKEELASMGKYMPLFFKVLYYQFKNRDMLPDYKLWGGIQKGKGGIDFGGGSRKIDFGGDSKKIDFGGGGKKIDFGK